MPISHRKFEGMYICKVSVALEGVFYIVDGKGTVDCFPSAEAAFSAGGRALISIINKRIVLPSKNALKAQEIAPRLKKATDEDLDFGFSRSDYY